MFWDRLGVIFARSVTRGIKWLWEALLNVIMPKNEALLSSIKRELNKMKKTQWQLNILNDHASVRAGVYTLYPAKFPF